MPWPCRVQLPALQLADPERDQLLPAGPVPPPCQAQVPPEQLPEPPKLVVPRRPVTAPLRVQALASLAVAAAAAATNNKVAISLFTSLSRGRCCRHSCPAQQKVPRECRGVMHG
ncbi:hypothetical protein BBta_3218 [Bradyrhizobium sp. BTAi1]|nr:hypothetical protein BBta_3218 [Bradyrhizobium sp. BTAi1]